MQRLEGLYRSLKVIAGIRIRTGRLISPLGTEYKGIEVSVGDGYPDPASKEHAEASIKKVLDDRKVEYVIHEERTPSGTFKSFSLSTG